MHPEHSLWSAVLGLALAGCTVVAQRQSYIVVKQQTTRQQLDARSRTLHLPPFTKVFRNLE